MDGHPQSCGRCGGVVQARSLRGVQAFTCRSCGLVMFQPRALERLLGAPLALGPVEPTRPVAEPTERGSSLAVKVALVGAGAMAGSLLVSVLLGLYLLRPQPLALPDGPTLDAALTPRAQIQVEGAVTPEASTEEAPEDLDIPEEPEDPGEAATEEAAAEPVEEPPPRQPAPRPRLQTLLDRGWSQVVDAPEAAAESFRRALDLEPGDAEANYGYGYALLRQGDPSRAKPFLCQAQQGGDIEVTRDVQALLAQNGLTCR